MRSVRQPGLRLFVFSMSTVYGYDAAGRLTDVIKDGVAISHYGYDDNGNRLAHTTHATDWEGPSALRHTSHGWLPSSRHMGSLVIDLIPQRPVPLTILEIPNPHHREVERQAITHLQAEIHTEAV